MSKVVEKKLRKHLFAEVENDVDRIDVRLADFDLEIGDIVRFKEFDHETREFTGRTVDVEVTNLVSTKRDITYWTDEEVAKYGFYVMHYKKAE